MSADDFYNDCIEALVDIDELMEEIECYLEAGGDEE